MGEIVFDAFNAAFGAVTAFFHAAERELGSDDAVLVDADHPGLQPATPAALASGLMRSTNLSRAAT